MGIEGKSCPRSLPCGQNGCKKMHHVLLHRNDDRQVKAKPKCYIPNKSFPDKTCHNPPGARHIVTNNLDRATEGHDKTKESQMETQDDYTADFRGLHIVPIVFAQGITDVK